MREGTPPETFASDFVSHLIRRTYGKAGAGYVQALRHYFNSVAALRSQARSKKLEFQILLETGNESRLRKTREVLELLGWTIRRSEGRIRVELGTDELAALRQTFSSALGVDEMEMKSQLEAGASYRLTFSDQRVPIIFEERFWLRRFFEGNRPVGGLLRAFAENIPSARLYAGLAAMNDEARRLVVETYTSRELLEVHPNSLLAYGSALSVRQGGLLLPGGASAAAAWAALLETRTDRPKRFVRRLFSQDNGKPMAFYHALINLPEENQRFLTSSPGRLAKFYAAFPFTGSEEAKRRIVNHRIPFRNLVRELPLDRQGRIRFPGSARVWSVSHGWSGSPDEIPRSEGLAAPSVAREAEDQILLGLPLEEYQFGMKKHSMVENFLAAVHLERHWDRPMAEEAALLLSRHYPKYREIFPYLASLPRPSTQQLQRFFQAARNVEEVKPQQLERHPGTVPRIAPDPGAPFGKQCTGGVGNFLDSGCSMPEICRRQDRSGLRRSHRGHPAAPGAGLARPASPGKKRFVVLRAKQRRALEDPGAATGRHRRAIDGGPRRKVQTGRVRVQRPDGRHRCRLHESKENRGGAEAAAGPLAHQSAGAIRFGPSRPWESGPGRPGHSQEDSRGTPWTGATT